MSGMSKWAVAVVLSSGLALVFAGCRKETASGDGSAVSAGSKPDGKDPATALDPSKVLAKVGDRNITLGDYQAALARMDRFERLRYQTPERRRLLLDEMINVELLAREAERRGLQHEPETQAQIRMLQREEVLRRLRAEQPALEELPNSEVRAYYEAHRTEYSDPERRRVAVIRVASEALAKTLLESAQAADAEQWGELVRKHSIPARVGERPSKNSARPPLELEGDLGLVSAPGEPKGDNPRVPEPVRRAVFAISEPGRVHSEIVADGGAFYVVRLVAKNDARERSFAEAEPAIRVAVLQERLRRAERELSERLERELPVVIDETLLDGLSEPTTPVATSSVPTSLRPAEKRQ